MTPVLAAASVEIDWIVATFVALFAATLIVWAALLPRLPYLDHLEEILIGTLMALATLLIFVSVAQRYSMSAAIGLANWGKEHGQTWLFDGGRSAFKVLRGLSLTWAQELCIYMFVWMAKFGAAFGVRQGIHVGVDVLIARLKGPSRARVILFGLFCGALFTFIVGLLGTRFVYHIAHTDQISADLEVPMWLVYIAVPVGSFLMCFRFLQVAFEFARTGDLPHHDHGHVDGLDDADTVVAAPTSALTAGAKP